MNQYDQYMNLKTYLEHFGDMIERDDNIEGAYRSIVLWAYDAVNAMLQMWLSSRGYEFNEDGIIDENTSMSVSDLGRQIQSPIDFVLSNHILPIDLIDAVEQMVDTCKKAECGSINRETILQMSHYYDHIGKWFRSFITSDDIQGIDNGMKKALSDRVFSLYNMLTTTTRKPFRLYEDNSDEIMSQLNIMHGQLTGLEEGEIRLEEGQTSIRVKQNEMSEKLDQISLQIMSLSENIKNNQDVVTKQLNAISDPKNEERILSEFTNHCVNIITDKMESHFSDQMYLVEEQKIHSSLGDGAWNKLDEKSKTFLTTAKVIFQQMYAMENLIDYSGVCLLVSKTVELEIKNRFFFKFCSYLNQKYSGSKAYEHYPTFFLDKHGDLIEEENFTLGGVPFVFCIYENKRDTEEQKENNKSELMEFCKTCVFPGKGDAEIQIILEDYNKDIDKIRKDYRNPSAHTNALGRISAEECFNFVLDAEQVLKKMLDSFVS